MECKAMDQNLKTIKLTWSIGILTFGVSITPLKEMAPPALKVAPHCWAYKSRERCVPLTVMFILRENAAFVLEVYSSDVLAVARSFRWCFAHCVFERPAVSTSTTAGFSEVSGWTRA